MDGSFFPNNIFYLNVSHSINISLHNKHLTIILNSPPLRNEGIQAMRTPREAVVQK